MLSKYSRVRAKLLESALANLPGAWFYTIIVFFRQKLSITESSSSHTVFLTEITYSAGKKNWLEEWNCFQKSILYGFSKFLTRSRWLYVWRRLTIVIGRCCYNMAVDVEIRTQGTIIMENIRNKWRDLTLLPCWLFFWRGYRE